jgi:hypothetical protein
VSLRRDRRRYNNAVRNLAKADTWFREVAAAPIDREEVLRSAAIDLWEMSLYGYVYNKAPGPDRWAAWLVTLIADTELALVDPAAFAPRWPAADVDMHQVLEQLRHVDVLADRADLLFALHTHARERFGPDAAGVLWWLARLYRDTATASTQSLNTTEAR